MKNNKFAKISLMILTLALCFGAVFAMNAVAEDATPAQAKPEIISQNIEYSKDFRLMYAVDASTVAAGAVTLYVYSTEPSDDTANVVKEITVNEPEFIAGNLNKNVYKFITPGVSYTEMTTNYYVQAVDSLGNKSEVKRYSVAEYLYERLSLTGELAATDEQKALYNNAIAFGNSSQIVINKEIDTDALISNLRYVKVSGGTVDGYNAGVYPIGSTLDLVADNGTAGAKWSVVTYKNGALADSKLNQTSVIVEDADKIEVICGETIVLREGTQKFDGLTAIPTDSITYSGTATNSVLAEKKDGDLYLNTTAESNKYLTGLLGVKEEKVEGANAIEASFDMKFDITSEKAWNGTEIRFSPSHWAGGTPDYRFTLWKKANSDEIMAGSNADVATGLNNGEWIRVRMVIYEGDTNMYVYFNDSETPAAVGVSTSSTAPSETILGQQYPGLRIILKTNLLDTDNYELGIDNLFVGYINEANPNTTTE